MSEINFEIRADLKKDHADYDFYRRSYEGGTAYKEGNYLIRHSRELQEDFERRVEQSSYVNFCADTVDIKTSYLLREQPARTFERDSASLEAFKEDADFEGRTWDQTVRNVVTMAGYYGIMLSIIDKPEGNEEASQGAELEAGVRPYHATYSPLALWDYTYTKDESGKPVLSELILEEENHDPNIKHIIIQWEIGKWTLWHMKEDGGWESVGSGTNKLTQIPIAILRNLDSFKRFKGKSDLIDIADVNRRLFFLDSNGLEIIDNTAFPAMQGPRSSVEGEDGKGQEKTISSAGIIMRDDGPLSETGFNWLEPPNSSLEAILKFRESAIADLKYMAKTGKANGQEKQAESGVALKIQYQQLNAILGSKAENLEKWEKRCFELVGAYEDVDYGVMVEYPRTFGVEDASYEIDTAITSKALITSATYSQELAKKYYPKMISRDTDPEIMKKIENEIMQPAELPGSENDGEDDPDV